jgi:uncharacterized membrane protein
MIAFLQAVLAPYYLYLKLVHLVAVTVWLWSTAVGYSYYLVPVFKAWRRNPGDADIVALRDWVMDRFDQGVIYEHLAFPTILVTGPLLWIAGGWTPEAGWFLLKLLIIVSIFVPMEICDYYLSHLGGNKRRLREAGDTAGHERAIHIHWWFLLLSTAPVMVFGVLVLFLAVIKPF